MSFIDFAKQITKSAGKMMLEYYEKEHDIHHKGEIDFALQADLDIEKWIVTQIQSNYPDHGILAEESGENVGKTTYKWIIDPIDGTANFREGIPYFCTTIALQKDGKIIVAVAYSPLTDELFYAEQGGGAYLNGNRIYVSEESNLRQFLFSYSTSNHKNNMAVEKGSGAFTRILENCRAVRLQGSSILDLCNLARGTFDGLVKVEASYWDFAAGSLIVEEAGGAITDWEGKTWSEETKYVLGSNGKMHSYLVAMFKEPE